MRIIGIDPGTGILGFGVVETDGQKHKLVDAGVVRTPVKEDDGVRLQTIYEEICDIIAENKPEQMAIEKLFFAQNVTTAMTVAQARGVVLLAGMQAGLKIAEYTPLQIKQSLTGYGRAEKKQMIEMVHVLLGLKRDTIKVDDCADALAAALTLATSLKVK